VILVGRGKLDAFWRKHPDARRWIEGWVAEVERADWSRPQDIRDSYPSATVISRSVIVFDVGGNKYRMETLVSFERGVVSVQRWGTHAEYDRWDL
jgi:mRNA interferase HigB